MIADYLYNTPSLTTETGAFVLLTQQFANVAALNSALLGKTLAQIRALSSVLGTADVGTDRVVPTQHAKQHQRMAAAHAPLLHCRRREQRR